MKILGLDPGTATTGFGLIKASQDTLNCIRYGVIKTDSKTKLENRLMIIYSELEDILKEYKPEAIAIEKIFFFKNPKTIIPVSEARGIMLLAAAKYNIPIYEFTPLQVKMAVTGYGRAEKKQVQEMVKNLLNLEKLPKPNDAADALAIAISHSYTL